MKIRNGWVGNSSSSSFILLMCEPDDKEEFKTWFEDCGHRSEWEETKVLNILNMVDIVKKLINENKISNEDTYTIFNMLCSYIENIPDIFIHNYDSKTFDNICVDNYYKEYTREKVIDILWNAWENKGIAKFDEDGNIIEDNIRVFNEIKNWQEQLKDPNSYIYQTIKEEVDYGLDEKIDYRSNGRTQNILPMYNEDIIQTYDLRDKQCYKDLIDTLAQQKINYIHNLIDDYKNELKCYVITFCSDDGNSTEFDYIGRNGNIFRNTLFCIRNENS